VKFSVKREKGATAHKLEITPRKWSERSVVSVADAADRSWVIGFQRFAKGNWPANLTGEKLVAELERMAEKVFVYGGATEMPPTAASVGIAEGMSADEILAKLRAAGTIQ